MTTTKNAPESADDWPPSKPSDEVAPNNESDAVAAENTPDTLAAPAADDMLVDILRSVYRAEGMTAQGFATLRERLATIEERLGLAQSATVGEVATSTAEDDRTHQPAVVKTIPDVATSSKQPIADTASELPSAVTPVAQPAAETPSPVPQPIQPVRDVRPVNVQHGHHELDTLVFGHDLAYHEGLLPQRQALLTSVRQGDEDAIGLVGQLLIVRSATMDRLPTLLKDVGEAWYRWRTNDVGGADPLRDAVIGWLHGRLDAVGLNNRIELVRLGDRYDSKRHNAKARGVEVTGVQGWVVLRDNGNVYTKANVVVA